MVAHACNPSTLGGRDRRIWVHGQPQLLSEALCNLVRPCFKIKNKKWGWGCSSLVEHLPSANEALGLILNTTQKIFFAVELEPRGILPPSYTPSPIFYFETGSH